MLKRQLSKRHLAANKARNATTRSRAASSRKSAALNARVPIVQTVRLSRNAEIRKCFYFQSTFV
jgi:hypothetical protein